MNDEHDPAMLVKGWTLDTLFFHFSAVIRGNDKRYEQINIANEKAIQRALANAEKSNDKAEESLKEYKVGSNEWRDTVKDLVSRMPSRSEIEAMNKNLDDKIDRVEKDIRIVRESITPGLGPRVSALEIAKSNLDGRFWALAAVVVVLEVVMQLWPLLRPH